MIKDITIRKLLIIILFLTGSTIDKPKFIKNYFDDFPLLTWILLFLVLVKKNDAYVFVLIFTFYQILFIIDKIYLLKKGAKKEKIISTKSNKKSKRIN